MFSFCYILILILTVFTFTGYNRNDMSANPTLLLPTAYVSDAAKHIRQATTRVSFLCTVVADDDMSDELIDALEEAALRGVAVEVAVDLFTYTELGGYLFPSQYKSRQSRASTRMSKRLTKSGVKFTWLGRSHATIFSGRTHIKWCVVDNVMYSFGGVNLYKEGIENTDYMFRIEDALLADMLFDEYHRLSRADAGGYAYRSHSIEYGPDTILIDGGLIGDSIIYRRAVKLTAEASKVVIVSQYCPTGKLSKALRHTDSRVYFNPPSNASGLNKAVIRLGMFVSKQKTLYTRSKYLHAKFMLFYMADGRIVALTGSHNFSGTGVLLGTREIALQTENPQTIAQLEDFIRKYVA